MTNLNEKFFGLTIALSLKEVAEQLAWLEFSELAYRKGEREEEDDI